MIKKLWVGLGIGLVFMLVAAVGAVLFGGVMGLTAAGLTIVFGLGKGEALALAPLGLLVIVCLWAGIACAFQD